MDFLTEVFELERLVMIKRRKIMSKLLEKEGLYFGQPRILKAIANNKECDQNTLAKELECSKASVTTSVKRLEKAGLVEKKVSPKDMRCNIITLTEKGIEKSKRAKEILDYALSIQYDSFDKSERDNIIKCFKKMIADMERTEN